MPSQSPYFSSLISRRRLSQASLAQRAAKTITLETLEKAANALNCTLVYALVPKAASLEEILTQQAQLRSFANSTKKCSPECGAGQEHIENQINRSVFTGL